MAKKTGKETAKNGQGGAAGQSHGAETPIKVRTMLGRVRRLAAVRADDIKGNAEAAEFPVLCLAAAYTEQAFNLAVGAAQWTRNKNPPTVADFVNLFAELHECRSRARELLEGQDKGRVWEHWPAAPGTVYCWKADNSALAVAYAFARMVETEIYCNCRVSYNALSTLCDTPAFSEWRRQSDCWNHGKIAAAPIPLAKVDDSSGYTIAAV